MKPILFIIIFLFGCKHEVSKTIIMSGLPDGTVNIYIPAGVHANVDVSELHRTMEGRSHFDSTGNFTGETITIYKLDTIKRNISDFETTDAGMHIMAGY